MSNTWPPPEGGGTNPPPDQGSTWPPPPGGYPPPPGASPPGAGWPPPPGNAPPPPPGYGYGYTQAGAWGSAPDVFGMPFARYGQRVIAYLIDVFIVVALMIVLFLVGFVGYLFVKPIGVFVWIVDVLAAFAYGIWNQVVRQGRTGQSLGKSQQGISLVTLSTGQPPGAGTALARYAIYAGINSLCNLYGIVDLLWPLWDEQNQRLTDKMLKLNVVQTQKTPMQLNPFA